MTFQILAEEMLCFFQMINYSTPQATPEYPIVQVEQDLAVLLPFQRLRRPMNSSKVTLTCTNGPGCSQRKNMIYWY